MTFVFRVCNENSGIFWNFHFIVFLFHKFLFPGETIHIFIYHIFLFYSVCSKMLVISILKPTLGNSNASFSVYFYFSFEFCSFGDSAPLYGKLHENFYYPLKGVHHFVFWPIHLGLITSTRSGTGVTPGQAAVWQVFPCRGVWQRRTSGLCGSRSRSPVPTPPPESQQSCMGIYGIHHFSSASLRLSARLHHDPRLMFSLCTLGFGEMDEWMATIDMIYLTKKGCEEFQGQAKQTGRGATSGSPIHQAWLTSPINLELLPGGDYDPRNALSKKLSARSSPS